MTKHIRIIFPGSKVDFHTQEDLNKINLPDCNIDIISAKVGPETISSRCEEVLGKSSSGWSYHTARNYRQTGFKQNNT